MKQLIMWLMLLPTLAIQAQKSHYLAGAVPVVDGRVVFEKQIVQPNKTAHSLYELAREVAQTLKKETNSLPATRIEVENAEQHVVVIKVHEWLTFKRTALVLDRAQFIYTLSLVAKDEGLSATIKGLSYVNEADPMVKADVIRAEQWITDEYGLNKKKTKLAKISGKFRVKTIDRVNEIFDLVSYLVTVQ